MNTILDLSGNGNNGTISGCYPTRDGLSFDGTNDIVNIDTCINDLATTTQGTFMARVKFRNIAARKDIVSFGNVNAITEIVFINFAGVLRCAVYIDNVGKWVLSTSSALLAINNWYTVAIVQDGANPVLYLNGVAVSQTFDISTDKTFWFNNIPGLDTGRIGDINFASAGEGGFLNGQIQDVKIYNRALSLQEVKNYHNQFAKRLYLRDNFEDLNCDGNTVLPKDFIKGTGSYKGVVETTGNSIVKKGQKYLQCTVAGTIALPSKQAYGKFHKVFFKGADANVQDWLFIASTTGNATTAPQNGYLVRYGNDEKFYLYKITNGVLSAALITSASTYAINTYYNGDVTRTTDGVFILYVNSASIGTATDNTFTTSNFMVEDDDASDKFTDIQLFDGVVV